MKNYKIKISKFSLLLSLVLVAVVGCERDLPEDAAEATFTSNAEVFIDGFSSGLEYYPYADSKQTAFSVDDDAYKGTSSMRFDIPNVGDPEGAYAGAIFRDDNGGRDLSQYDALTFWAKGTRSGTINSIGFGQDFFANRYEVSTSFQLTTNWVKYVIPIPDASRLTQEKGMFWYAEGPENGEGYSFWVDELKFEKLGTIAHARAMISNGEDVVVNTLIGVSLKVEGLSAKFNLGDGRNQDLNLAPAYFDFASSNPSVATVDELGNVSVVGEGTSTITASFLGEDVEGSLVVNSLGEFLSAPTPTHAPEDVISIYSDAYENVPVEFFNGYWQPFQTTESTFFTANDDNVISYFNFNFVGNQFGSPTIDASEMTAIHFDVFVPEGIANPQLEITIKDFGANGQDGGDDDTTFTQVFSGPSLVPGQWNALEITFDNLANKSRFGQIIYANLGSPLNAFYLDNVYCYKTAGGGGGGTGPTEAAPTPTQDAADVISVFSDAYTDVAGSDYNPNWGQATVVTQEDIAGNNTLVYTGLNYQGLQLGSAQDVSGMDFLHIDYWTANSTTLNAYLISSGPVETAKALTVPTGGSWSSIDIPLGDFNPVDLADIIQFKFDGDGDIYLDNIFFYKSDGGGGGGGTAPTEAAPTPTQDAADVISVFSDAYTDVAGTDYNPNWGQATVVTQEDIAGNNTLVYTGLNYQGIQLGSAQDVTGMEFLHIDFWTANSTALNAFLISTGPIETAKALTVPTGGGWSSIDIPLGDFSPVDLADIIQFKFDGNGDIYLDNIFFYKTSGGGGGGTAPTEAAPTPTQDAADVISVFSDAYTDVAGTDYNPNWGQATVVTQEDIAGNNTLVYTGLNYQGIALGSAQDVTDCIKNITKMAIIAYWF